MARKGLAIFEVELVLAAFLGGTRGGEAVGLGVAQDGGPELLVGQHRGLVPGRAARQRGAEAVVDDLLGRGDLFRLVIAQRRLPVEQARLERAAMIERHEIERAIVAPRWHRVYPLSLR